MSQIPLANPVQLHGLQQQGQEPAVVGNQPQPVVQQPAAQADPNAAALAHLSDKDRAAAEMFLKGTNVQEAAKYTKWSLATKIVTGILTFGIAPAIMCRREASKEKELAADAVRLKNAMNRMAKDNRISQTAFFMDDKYVPVTRNQDGTLTATIGGQRIISKFPPKVIAELIEDDIVANTDLYGKRAALDLFSGKESVNKNDKKRGHAGRSLAEQYQLDLAKCQKEIAKAEAQVKKDAAAPALLQELEEAKTSLDALQTAYDKTEADCNRTLLKCVEQIESAEKAQKLLSQDLQHGATDPDGVRQKAINDLKASALADKAKAQATLQKLYGEDKQQLEAARARKNTAQANVDGNASLTKLKEAKNAQETLTNTFTSKRDELKQQLAALKASPNRQSPQVQAQISALRSVLAAPDNGVQAKDPRQLNLSDPKDALDSMGVNDSRHRDLCIKAIKIQLGIDGGELHSCPTRYLDRIAQYALEGYYGTAKNLIDHVLKIATTNRIASQDVMELMNVRQQDANTGQKVNVAVLRPNANQPEPVAQKVSNFAADIIFSGNIVDEDTRSPEERLGQVLKSNAGLIGDMVRIETCVNAVELEGKAKEAEQKAALPNANTADKTTASIARAEANAAQFAAKTLQGNVFGKGLNAIGNFFGNFFGGQKKVDEKAFTGMESQAWSAQAAMLKERQPLELSLEQAQANVREASQAVAESENDPALLSDLVNAQKALADAQKALDDFNQNSPLAHDAITARLAVRLARAEAQAKLTGNEEDQKKVDDLRQAIKDAEPGVPDASLGAEFDVPADTALGERLTTLEQLPENERASVLKSLPENMADAIRDMVETVRDGLLEKNMPADTASISIGLTQLGTQDLQKIVQQVNDGVVKATSLVQDEMTAAILAMDASLVDPTKVVLREIKAALEAEHLPMNKENIEAFMEREHLPASVSTAVTGLADAVTGVDNAERRRHLAIMVATNAMQEYARLEDEALQAEANAQQAAQDLDNAKNRNFLARNDINAAAGEIQEKNDLRKAAQDKANQSREAAEQAETAAATAEEHATNLENAASAAEAYVQSLRDSSAAQEAIDAALGEAKTAQDQAKSAREEATKIRTQATEARALADKDANDFLQAQEAYLRAVQHQVDAINEEQMAALVEGQANQAKSNADATAWQARAKANTALGIAVPAMVQHDVVVVDDGDEDDVAAPQAQAPAQPEPEPQAQIQNPHQARLAQLAASNLDSLVAAAGTDFSSDGVGKFVKFVIQDYFQSVPLRDKRAMVAAGLRYAPPNATPMQQLGAMLKGAGPVLQKIFQGLDGPGLPQDLRIACQDMKSRLAPIPPDIVEATLLDMVNSSNGRITNIEVLSSLGAASVGQAFLCRMTDKNGQTRDCVVKILRPDAANRVKREQPIFERAAAKVPGMLGTFRGQLQGIMEELDFSIESGNAKVGAVYDSPFNGAEKSIQSVKIVEDIPPKSTSMAMELAPGTTLDAFTRNTREEIAHLGENLGRFERYNENGQRTKVYYDVPESRVSDLIPAKKRLQELYDAAQARHKQLTALAEVWVTEGIFGEQGFFHGDLHAGNIMSDGQKLTVIDFGNATKLSVEQQSAVTTMIVATTTRQSSKFLNSFRELLPAEARAVFDSKREQILESVRVIMQKGGMGDTGGRIAAILSEIQRNGVEIPHAIYNFSNSQIRLQNSIDEMITLMHHIQEDICAIDNLRHERMDDYIPLDFAILDRALRAMADENQSQESVLTHIQHVRADIENPDSELNIEQRSTFETLFSVQSEITKFKARIADKDPKLSQLWNANKDALEDINHPQHQAAMDQLLEALRQRALDQLSALEAEELSGNRRSHDQATFLDVMSDVVDTNRNNAIKKLGFVSSTKYGITTFIHDHITERVSPKI